jgi:thymidylate kinase
MSYQRTAAEYNDTFEKDQKLMVDVHKNYRVLARKFKWKIINGEQNREEVHQDIMKIIKSLKV